MIEICGDMIVQAAVNATSNSTSAGGGSGPIIPDSTFLGVIASVISAVTVYSVRQYWEKKKLRQALLTEIGQMEGLKTCADSMNSISTQPPKRGLQPDDVPSPESIPTAVYDNNTGKIGVLSVFNSTRELENVVEFYSKVKRYKSTIAEVRQGTASDPDEEDLYDDIEDLNKTRCSYIQNGEMTEQ